MQFVNFFLQFLLISTSIRGEDDSKIQEGFLADITRFPFLGRLLDSKYQPIPGGGCSTTLVDRLTALTAGHCISEDKTSPNVYSLTDHPFYVIMGVTNWKDKENPLYQQQDVLYLYHHPKISLGLAPRIRVTPNEFDIGAVKLKRPMSLSATVQLAPFPVGIDENELFEEITGRNGRCEIAGWGNTKINFKNRSDVTIPLNLNSAKFNVISKDDCCNRYYYGRLFSKCMQKFDDAISGLRCHERHKINSSVAGGDSGSPLVCPFKGKCYVVGVHSSNAPSFDPPGRNIVPIGNPGFYVSTKVMLAYVIEVKGKPPIYRFSGGEKNGGFHSFVVISTLHFVRFLI